MVTLLDANRAASDRHMHETVSACQPGNAKAVSILLFLTLEVNAGGMPPPAGLEQKI